MGADGSIKLSRKDLIGNKTIKKQDSNTTTSQSVCQLSNNPLDPPLMSDYKGNIYNKISILEYLINPDSFSLRQKELVKHITSKRDVIDLNIKSSKKDSKDGGEIRIICPITGDILGQTGGKFGYVVECGDVFAIRSLKELNDNNNRIIKENEDKDQQTCPVCDIKFRKESLIIIGAKDEDLNKQEERIKNLQIKGLTHSLKKKRSLSKENKSNTKKLKT